MTFKEDQKLLRDAGLNSAIVYGNWGTVYLEKDVIKALKIIRDNNGTR